MQPLAKQDFQQFTRGLHDLTEVLSRIYGTGIPDFDRSNQGLLAPFDKVDVDLSVVGDGAIQQVTPAGVVTYQVKYFPNAGDFLGVDDSPTWTSLTGEESYVTFNQQNNDANKAPMFLSPGKTFSTPYKGFTLYYVQTAAKRVRFLFSTGSRFVLTSQAISSILAAVKISDTNGNSIDSVAPFGSIAASQRYALSQDGGYFYSTTFSSTALFAAGSAIAMLAAGSNVNGAVVWNCNLFTGSLAANVASVLAKATTPATPIDGDPIHSGTIGAGINAGSFGILMPRSVRVAAGKGVWAFSSALETIAYKSALITVY